MKTLPLSRIFCLLLAWIMVLSIAACSETGVGSENTTAPSASGTTAPGDASGNETTEDVDEDGYKKDSLPSDLNFNNKEVAILHWNDADYEEFFVEDESGEIVSDALYKRNCNVEERLGVRLEFIGTAGDTYNEAPFALTLSTNVESGERPFDIVGAYSYTAGLCAVQNLYYDLSNVEHLDFEKPWWPNNLINQATINNKLYFVSGDISANVIYAMYVTFFNKEILNEFQLEDPFSLVHEGKWTIDKQFEMCKGVYLDSNANGVKDLGDRSGLYVYTLHLDSYLWGSDIFIIDSTNGEFKLSDEFMGEKTYSLQQKLKTFLGTSNDGIHVTVKEDNHKYFGDGVALFVPERCHRAIEYSDGDVDFGVLPIPKYDEDQAEYITIMGNTFSLYSAPVNVADANLAGAVLECMASESYRNVTPALYERSFQYRYSQEEVSAQMFDIAKNGVVFDMSRIFSNSLGAYKAWQKAITGVNAWPTTVERELRVWNNQIDKILDSFN